jgi:hypothetical protein
VHTYLPRMISLGILAVLLTTCMSPSLAANAQAAPAYSTAPLREPLLSDADVAVATAKLTSQLEMRSASLDDARKAAARERLYYLIESRIKHSFETTHESFPAKQDAVLAALFFWAERLGVYGGNQVYNALKDAKAPPMDPLLALPAGISLKYSQEMLLIDSDAGWRVAVPYYFMIGRLDDVTVPNGARWQILMVSTGTAKDVSKLGHSQATLLLVFGPGADLKSSEDYWNKSLELPAGAEEQKLGVRGLTSRHHLQESLKLHKEVTFWKAESGTIGVFYLGNEGTYQWNREHFLDFLRAVSTPALTAH